MSVDVNASACKQNLAKQVVGITGRVNTMQPAAKRSYPPKNTRIIHLGKCRLHHVRSTKPVFWSRIDSEEEKDSSTMEPSGSVSIRSSSTTVSRRRISSIPEGSSFHCMSDLTTGHICNPFEHVKR